ncbi:MAG: hypothetical protein ABW166_21205 [Sedimenticola sp.]
MILLTWASAVTLTGCSSDLSPPFLNYQQCKKDMTAEYRKQGEPKIKAELDARDYCRKLYAKK